MNQNIDLLISYGHTMAKNWNNIIGTWAQWILVLVTNLFFVCKYIPRIGINPCFASIVYSVGVIGIIVLYRHTIRQYITERMAKCLSITLIIGILCLIACTIVFIDPYSIQVDRWSATTFFLDALFDGIYPYGVHTHVSQTNFPSPFPLWHYLNIPAWLIGDVGWMQALCLIIFMGTIWAYFKTWNALLNVLLILCISPAYWWEIVVRSDGLSNLLLVMACILILERNTIQMDNKWWLLALIAGCIASTRLSAIIPIALYLFRPWLDVNWKKKIGFIAITLLVVLCFFLPYILWDTTNWVFFQRNPLMTQTSPGNPWILGIMVIAALCIAYRKQTFSLYASTTAIFMFTFMLFTQLGVIWRSDNPVSLFDSCCDISYFTLSLPFAIVALVSTEQE